MDAKSGICYYLVTTCYRLGLAADALGRTLYNQ